MIEIDEDKLIRCPICGAVNIDKGKENRCRRCDSAIYHHKRFSTERSWAYLITAMIAYIPANIYPMLITKQFGSEEGNTLLGGVVMLWEHGSYPIAMIIFVASILIPVLKFLVLIYLLISVKYPIGKDKKVNKHKLYYMTEVIGPWSMIDVFVVAILAALIHLANIEIIAGMAATAFALSVFFTLLAAHAFNERLIKGYQ
ncbi:paraquat-inducible protein A [Sulfurovum sp. XTW-4]|uniref:Paraquat-inducible protein A n=1 Tax=Sulfurovum xiamenensis TaxID=3019066 RepID=A0ABT7QTM6_9BACT|nr:paraquat-inducible protein A [Sulfurovum xiamenensis]MDM5264365.1 paraquat-inducible protein A [Sulfurovum xiamenensis]